MLMKLANVLCICRFYLFKYAHEFVVNPMIYRNPHTSALSYTLGSLLVKDMKVKYVWELCVRTDVDGQSAIKAMRIMLKSNSVGNFAFITTSRVDV